MLMLTSRFRIAPYIDIFNSESLASLKISETLAKEVGAKVVPIMALESRDDKSYIEAIRYNLDEIYKCLSEESNKSE